MLILSLSCVATLLYIYLGYPLLLRFFIRLRGERPIRRRDITPRVSLLISAFNEADVIRQKLENALSLEYPRDLLEVVVVSDASTDGTDEIVASFANRGVALRRQPERRGKTVGLNDTVPTLRGEIVVFSDANAMYQPDALLKLVRNFADREVGCVTGEARYVKGGGTAADLGERAYWNYEMQIKRLETVVGSMVGGDGAIYAIRKHLWKALPASAINDFLNPLQIVAAGWRAIYEPEAICLEEPAGSARMEYRRRVRIVSRSWRAVFQAPAVLNPFRVGFFAVKVVSHKLLRWLTLAFVIVAVGAWFGQPLAHGPFSTGALAVLLLAGGLSVFSRQMRRLVALGLYFTVVNVASVVGVLRGTFGFVSGTWATTREYATDAAVPAVGAKPRRRIVPSAILLLSPVVLSAAVALVAWQGGVRLAATVAFWGSAAVLCYVYLGYASLLALLKQLIRRRVEKAPIEPSVCLFITANNEAAVIDAKLRNALEIDYPRDKLEILVASDGSVDATNAIVRAFAGRGVRLLEFTERRGKIAAINAGVPGVSTEIIVFSDANAFIDRRAVRALVRNFADPAVGAVSGDVVLTGERAALGASEDLYYTYERWLQRAESELGSMIGVDGALYAIRRELFTPPPDDTILDDVAIPMAVIRRGFRVVFEPDALALEQGSRTAWEEFERKSRIVAGAVQFLTRRESRVSVRRLQVIFALGSHKILRWLSPGFAVITFAASLVLARQSGLYMAATIAQAAFLVAGLAGCVPQMRRLKLLGIAHYFCLVHAAAAVGFVRGLMGQQATTWQRFERAPVQTT